MSETKKSPEKWKAETSREERKARLAAMKAKNGGKKPIRFSNPVVRLVIVLVLVVALLVAGAWYAIRLGVPTQILTAATVGGEKIKGTELNFYFYSICSQYGLSPDTEEGQTALKSDSGIEGFKTLADYVKDNAAKEVQNVVMLSTSAKNAGLSLTEADKQQIADYFTEAEAQAVMEGVSLDSLLADTFGAGMTKDHMQPILERILLANQYSNKKVDEMVFTDEQLNAYYEVNKDSVDVVDYRQFYIPAVYESDADEETIDLAMKAAKATAEKMLAEVFDDESFKAAAITYSPEDEKETYQTGDPTLRENVGMSYIATTEASTWAYDDARKAGDKIVSESSNGYYVILFKEKSQPDYNHISVRHILVDSDREEGTAEEIAAAKAKAEQILNEFLAGDKTAESFGKLAETNSTDTGSASNGGLYEDVAPGAMVEEFDAWCFDPARQPGDTGIVETEFGFHIMYFEKVEGVAWKIQVSEELKSEAYSKFLEDEAVKYPYTLSKLGMTFVG